MLQNAAKKLAGAFLVGLAGILVFGLVLYGAGEIGVKPPYRNYGHATQDAFKIATRWLGDASDAVTDEVDDNVIIRSGNGGASDLRAPAVGADPADAYTEMRLKDARLFQER